MSFNHYYQSELTALRQLGRRFAERSPALAPFLGQPGRDPDVERLLEGFAFLTGRLRQKLDDELPELSHSLMQLLWPNYMRPLPAFSILQFVPLTRSEPVIVVERDTPVESVPIEGVNCRFRTCYATDVSALDLVGKGVESSQASTARYVLCTVIDEAVVTTVWGKESEWSQMSLLSKFHNETFGGERFFLLLDRLSKNPVKHLPMLELMYLCLALGFEGKYRIQPRGLLELDNLRDALYRQIHQTRADVPRELSPHWQGVGESQRQVPVRIVPWWMVALTTLVCLLVMYSGFAWVLGEQRTSVLQPFQSFEQTAVQPQLQQMKGRG